MSREESDEQLAGLYDHHHDEVLAYCTRRVGVFAAEDVTADVFAVACRRIDGIAPEDARAWLFGVARGVLANRSSARRITLSSGSGVENPSIHDAPPICTLAGARRGGVDVGL